LTETHESIEELLAGYVLRSLSGEDAARVDHLLSDHVPLCPACRDSLAVVLAVAASMVAVVGFAGLAVTQSLRVNTTKSRFNDIASAMDFATRPGASMIQVNSSSADKQPITEISKPGVERFYLVGSNVPMPPNGTVYRVWLVSGTHATWAKDFLPTQGFTVVPLKFDPSLYDSILVSEEPAGSVPDTPEGAVWQTAS
jgi:hypothetical protein